MEDNIVIYGRQIGEPIIPLTVRIAWHANGVIQPMMYWTPDGTCLEILSQTEGIPLAYLKDRGEGLRFKVRAKIIETMEPSLDYLNAVYDTYLYLADRRFYQKNIIDERYGHTGKEYIPIVMDVFPDGDYELVYFWVHGARYKVEKTADVSPRGSFHAGGIGIWHKVDARLVNEDDDEDPDPLKSVRRPAALYWELNKWFVSIAKPA